MCRKVGFRAVPQNFPAFLFMLLRLCSLAEVACLLRTVLDATALWSCARGEAVWRERADGMTMHVDESAQMKQLKALQEELANVARHSDGSRLEAERLARELERSERSAAAQAARFADELAALREEKEAVEREAEAKLAALEAETAERTADFERRLQAALSRSEAVLNREGSMARSTATTKAGAQGGKGAEKPHPPQPPSRRGSTHGSEGKADKGGGGKSVAAAAAPLPPKAEAPVAAAGGEEVAFAEGKENLVHTQHARGVDESLDDDDLDIQSECVRLTTPSQHPAPTPRTVSWIPHESFQSDSRTKNLTALVSKSWRTYVAWRDSCVLR
jgi:hypothetical protein